MENLSQYSEIELLKMINDIKLKHDTLKNDVINLTYEYDDIEKKINEKIAQLNELEKNYVELIEEMSKR